ncbi:MAG: hypothetical protein P0S96_06370 [Simkaniaceae bacterium]|nr:hypothetical protein [Candidatus Sacchlamyda saccharinae]
MRALWGEVSSALRCASIKEELGKIKLFFYYDGKISEEDHESAECVATEVIAGFPDHQLETHVERLDSSQQLPLDEIGQLVYLRRENKC